MSMETPVSENVLSPDRPAEEPLAGEVAVDPTTGRPAGRPQALVLLLSSCLAVLGAVLLAPGAAPHPGRVRRHPRGRGADARSS